MVTRDAWPTPKRDLSGNLCYKENGDMIFENKIDAFDKFETRIVVETVNEVLQILGPLIPDEDYGDAERLKDILGKGHPDNARDKSLAEAKIAINPKDIEAWISLGVSKTRLGDLIGAKNDLEKAMTLSLELGDPENLTIVNYNLACTNCRLGDKSLTIKHLQKAIDSDKFYIKVAKKDPSFDTMRESPEFKNLIDLE